MVVRGHVQNGVVVLDDGIRLPEGQEVTVLSNEKTQGTESPKHSLARQTAGMMPWVGDTETLERIATDPEFGIGESA
jgi:hypothetical protein